MRLILSLGLANKVELRRIENKDLQGGVFIVIPSSNHGAVSGTREQDLIRRLQRA